MKIIKLTVILFLFILIGSCSFTKKKHFEGIKIIFFNGGYKDDPIASIIYNGARQAEEDFGCKIDYVFSNWDAKKMVDDFKDAIEKKPDGICIMGHAGDNDMMPLVDEAVDKGIIVTSQNVELTQCEDKYDDMGFGYVGQSTYRSGYNIAKVALKKLNIKNGDKIAVWGGKPNPNSPRKSRSDGVFDFLAENHLKAELLDMRVEDRGSPQTKGYEHFLEYYKANPDLKYFIVNGGLLTGEVMGIFKKAGIAPKKIKVVGFDLSGGSVAAIKEGYIEFINDQQPYLQGYLPILQICLSKTYGFSGLHINTDSSYIDDSNVRFFEEFVKRKIR